MRVSLREGTLADAEFIVALLNDPSFINHIGDKQVRTQKQAHQYIKNTFIEPLELGLGSRVITLLDGQPVGMVGLFQRPILDSPDLGFAMLSEHQGKGLMYEAANSFLTLHTQKFSTLYGITSQTNETSYSLLKKLGFTYLSEIQLENKTTKDRLLTLQRKE
ncbi:GNAT family N-acetyltransferase [Pseudoalteromonas pernae]|uniref:GNAT family N-acetyltransferase n=1 Tax=Pseudoalteromonas pernae TaxID=3118054 RepID=UPI00324282A4